MDTHKQFRILWIGQSFANLGDVFYMVGLITLTYQLTQSATIMSLIPFTITTAMFLSGFITPLLVDHVRLKPLLCWAQLLKTVLLLGMTIRLTFSLDTKWLPVTFGVVALIAFLDGTANPVRNAFVPQLVQPDRLVKANSFLAVIDQSIRLGGMPLGSLLVLWIGAMPLLWMVFGFFMLASLFMALLPDVTTDEPMKTRQTWESIREGWSTIWQSPSLKAITLMNISETIASVVWIAAILYIYVEEVLHVSTAWWGYINGAFFGGLIVGGLFCLKFDHLITRYTGAFMVAGLAGTSVITFWFGLTSVPLLALGLSAVIGIFTQMKDIAQTTVIQTHSPKHLLAKVYSAQDTLMTGLFGVSSLIVGYMTDLWNVRVSFIAAAGLLLIASGIAILKMGQLKIMSEE